MIINLGSVNFDLFFPISDLLPKGQIAMIERHFVAPGGKGGNQSVAASRGGAQVTFYGCVGDDGPGEFVLQSLQKAGVSTKGITKVQVPTGTAAIFVDEHGDHRVVYSQSANGHAKASQVPDAALTSSTLVLVQGDIPMSENEALIARAKKRGAKTALNLGPPAPISRTALSQVDYLIVNEPEANALGRVLHISVEDKKQFAKKLSHEFGMTVVITLGADGAIAIEPGAEKGLMVTPIKIDPVDMVGAGDAFIGHFLASIDRGNTVEESLRRGSVAGTLTCLAVGAQEAMPTYDEVTQRLHELPAVSSW